MRIVSKILLTMAATVIVLLLSIEVLMRAGAFNPAFSTVELEYMLDTRVLYSVRGEEGGFLNRQGFRDEKEVTKKKTRKKATRRKYGE